MVTDMSASMIRSARLISVLTLASRVLGLVRDMACGYAFGVRGVMSAFTVAFQVPNLFRRLFGEGALSAATIPVLTETLTRDGKEAADRLAGRVIAILVVVLVCVCLVTEGVVAGLYWSWGSDANGTLVLALTAMMLPYLILICTTAILGGIQNVFGRFAAPAAMPILLNIFMIAAALGGRWAMPGQLQRGVVLLAAAVMMAGSVQVALQWAMTRRCGLRLRLQWDTRDPAFRQIGLTLLPMIVGLGVVQINVLADSLIAYVFVKEQVPGAMEAERVGTAILYYAQRLYQFPLGVFSVALATAIFPALSRHAAEDDAVGLGRTLSKGIRVATFEGLPCLVGLILIREPLVEVLLKRGEFAKWGAATDRVAFAVYMYALGIWASALNHLVVRAFYSLKDATTPLRVSVVMVFLNLGLNLWLVQTPLKEAGLALATSICAALQAIWLLAKFDRRMGHFEWRSIIVSVAKTVVAVAMMGFCVFAANRYLPEGTSNLVRLVLMVAVGVVAYVVVAFVLRCEELRETVRK